MASQSVIEKISWQQILFLENFEIKKKLSIKKKLAIINIF